MIQLLYICLGFVFSYLGVGGIFGGDSSEYSFISHLWGIAHPPGYPLYALLANLMRITLPFLNEYVRLNLLSIVPGIAAVYCLYLSLHLITKNGFLPVGTSLYFIFLYPVWLYMEVPEVFMLNLFLISATTHVVLLISLKKRYSLASLLGILIGLSVAHHHTFIFFVPGWVYILKSQISTLKNKIIPALICMLLGASTYIYVPIASLFNPPLDIENAKTLEGFLSLFFRTSYGTFRAYNGASQNILNQIFNTLSTFIFLLHDYKLIGVVLIIVGLLYLRRHQSVLSTWIWLSISCYLFFLFLTNFSLSSAFTIATYERFLIALYYILAFPFAFGLLAIKTCLEKDMLPKIKNPFLHKVVCQIPPALIIGLIILNILQSYRYIGELRHLDAFNRYAKDLLNTPEKGSIVSIQGDTPLFSTAYYYYAKGLRNDLKYINFALLQKPAYLSRIKSLYPNLMYPSSQDSSVAYFLNQNNKNVAIYSNQPISIGIWMPHGLLWKYYEDENSASKAAEQIIRSNERLWSTYRIPTFSKEAKNILYVQNLLDDYLTMYNAYGLILSQRGDLGKAAHVFKDILTRYDKNYVSSAATLVELGFINGASCEKIKEYAHILEKNASKLKKDDVTTLLRYMNKCDKKNPHLDEYIKSLKLFLEPESTPLNQL